MHLYLPFPDYAYDAAVATAEIDPETSKERLEELFPKYYDTSLMYLGGLTMHQYEVNKTNPHPSLPSGYLNIMAPFMLFTTSTSEHLTPIRNGHTFSVSVNSIAIGRPLAHLKDADIQGDGHRLNGTWIEGTSVAENGQMITVFYPLPEAVPFIRDGMSLN